MLAAVRLCGYGCVDIFSLPFFLSFPSSMLTLWCGVFMACCVHGMLCSAMVCSWHGVFTACCVHGMLCSVMLCSWDVVFGHVVFMACCVHGMLCLAMLCSWHLAKVTGNGYILCCLFSSDREWLAIFALCRCVQQQLCCVQLQQWRGTLLCCLHSSISGVVSG
jgi:hypothetical protein